MTQRKSETHEQYLARCRDYNRQRYQDPQIHEYLNALGRKYHAAHRDEISVGRCTPEYREHANARLRERYASDPEFREKKKVWALEDNRKHQERNRLALAKRKAADPEAFRQADDRKGKRYRAKLRRETIEHYGGYKCTCCGETEPDFLAIDHIDGLGNRHRREVLGLDSLGGYRFYHWLRENSYPPGFQVLCHNCNFAKGHYGACPHTGPIQLPPVGRSGRQGRELRAQTIAAYGGRCTCCGETTPEFLSIDHLNEPQKGHLRAGDHLYRWLRREGWPAGFQLLCHSCNQAKGYYGACPHQRMAVSPLAS